MTDSTRTSDLNNNTNQINEFCHNEIETLYIKLAEAEAEIANGDKGKDFYEVARKLRKKVHGKK